MSQRKHEHKWPNPNYSDKHTNDSVYLWIEGGVPGDLQLARRFADVYACPEQESWSDKSVMLPDSSSWGVRRENARVRI